VASCTAQRSQCDNRLRSSAAGLWPAALKLQACSMVSAPLQGVDGPQVTVQCSRSLGSAAGTAHGSGGTTCLCGRLSTKHYIAATVAVGSWHRYLCKAKQGTSHMVQVCAHNTAAFATLTAAFATLTAAFATLTAAFATLTAAFATLTAAFATLTAAFVTLTAAFVTLTAAFATLTRGLSRPSIPLISWRRHSLIWSL
jgi:hypothetical protein